MAWMWWLLAPVVSTVSGAALIWWHGRRQLGSPSRTRDPMAEHHRLLSALAPLGEQQALPVTMRVLDSAG